MNPATVQAAAEKIRNAIESLPAEVLPITFSSFPRGACGDTCLILGTYLEEVCQLGSFEYISAERGSQADDTWTSHAWLQRNDLIVDITADQFDDAPNAIIVTNSSPWHDSFEIESRFPSNIKSWNGPGTYHVLALYGQIKRFLSSQEGCQTR